MEISKGKIDGGNKFDWGRTSDDYAKFRDIYPQEFYEKILQKGLCVNGQKVLDIGTGTGVIPRSLYRFGASWTGADISENQIEQAKKLSAERGMDIPYIASPAEKLSFPDNTFDVITACQCFWYLDPEVISPLLADMLKADGRLLIMCMNWLPYEDKTAGESERLVLKYNPNWNGAGETKHPIAVPSCMLEYFDIVSHEEFDLYVPFTRKSWHGRMKACRGTGASLPHEELKKWENEHIAMLEKNVPEKFDILHYGAISELKPKNKL